MNYYGVFKKGDIRATRKGIEFRYVIAGYIGISEILKRLDVLAEGQIKIWKEIKSIREEQTGTWKEIEGLRGDQGTKRGAI